MAIDSQRESRVKDHNGVNGINGANGYVNGISHEIGIEHIHGTTNSISESGCTQNGYEPIAIIGCAMRLPGGVETAESLWDFLDNRREGRCRVPADRYNIDAFYNPGRTGAVHSEYAHFLKDVNLAEVDTAFWSMTRPEIEEMDPQQRLALEVVYECFQNSGTTKWKGTNIGTYFGSFSDDWLEMASKETQQLGVYKVAGTGDSSVANRVSYEFGLRGPSMVIRTACSSSLIGLHEACLGIQRGECDSAIVGGTNLIMSPSMCIGMASQGAISPDGRSKSFDIKANGYARAEGVVAIHVKKLADAIRDNDPIRAVIRASCTNSDGKTSGITQPNPDAHHRLITRSHKLAGVDISRTAMIECHGTGTPVGDPLETGAVARAFGQHGVYIGSLKPNLGHSEGASGVSSTIKAMLALERRLIPPNINFNQGNPKIPFKENGLTVPVRTTAWPEGKAERIGINSFGIGGANAHVLLESAAENGVTQSSGPTPIADSHYLLTFSANHPDSLKRTVQEHEAYLKRYPERLTDLSYTLTQRREPLQHRAFSVVDANALDQALQVSTFGRVSSTPSVAFVFTGQGAQWPRMGADLINTNSVFRESIASMDESLRGCNPAPTWTLYEELQKTSKTSRIMNTEWSQPCCTAVQVALVDVLLSWGVKPSSVVGHSSGEIAAAYAAGSLSQDAAIKTAYYRGIATTEVNTIGGMAAVGLGRASVEPLLKPGVVIACENSPSSLTLSGDSDALEEVLSSVFTQFPDAAVRKLRVDCAYHSHHMRPAATKYLDLMPQLFAEKPRISFFSSVLGEQFHGQPDASYWAKNLVQPVLFSPAALNMLKHMPSSTPTVLLEIGPHSALAGPIRQIVQATKSNKIEYASAMTRGQPGEQSILTAAGRLWQLGVDPGLKKNSVTARGRTLVDLPLYPWRREGSFWNESRLSKSWRLRPFPKHDLLGERVTAVSDFGPTWRNILRLTDVSWLSDHKVAGDIIFPAAGFMSIAGEAARQLGNVEDSSYSLREVSISAALVLQEGVASEVITQLRPVKLTNSLDSAWYEFDISALHGDRWTRHVAGQVRQGAETNQIPTHNISPGKRSVDAPFWYQVLQRFGFEYGPHFQGLRDVTADVQQCKAVASVSGPKIPPHTSAYAIHPTTIDFALQMYSIASVNGQARRFTHLTVPSYIGSAYVHRTETDTSDIRLEVSAEVTPRGAIIGDTLGVSGGSTVISLQGIRMSPLADGSNARGEDPHAATEMIWKPDVRLMDKSQLLNTHCDKETSQAITKQIERLALACIVEASLSFAAKSDGGLAHLFAAKYRTWLDETRLQAIQGLHAGVPDSMDIATLPSSDRRALIDNLATQISESNVSMCSLVVAATQILDAAETPSENNLQENIIGYLHDIFSSVDSTEFYKLVSHYKPNSRILELNAGIGSTAKSVLDSLASIWPHRGRHYDSYTVTDLSSSFLTQAKENLAAYESISYNVLDISKDPAKQNFKEGSYDLIIAKNLSYASSNITTSLSHVRKLLAPTGHVFLQELSPASNLVKFVMGALSSSWFGTEDAQVNETLLHSYQWESVLHNADFENVTAVQHNQGLSTSVIACPSSSVRSKRVTILSPNNNLWYVRDVAVLLEKKGYAIDMRNWGEEMVPGQDVLALMDIEAPFLQDMKSDKYAQLQTFVRELKGSGVLWVTGSAQIKCTNPAYGLMIGLARTLRTEQTIDFATLELNHFNSAGWDAVATVLPEFQGRLTPDDETNPVMEWALADDQIQISRFHWISLNEELAVSDMSASARKLVIEKRGFLNTLYWKEEAPVKPTGNELRIQTRTSGLNFKDVLIAMGIIDGSVNEGNGLGLEAAGIVEEIGPDIKNFAVGDRCLVFVSGALSTHITTSESLCVKIPDGLSFEEAATIPTVYCTAFYSLVDKAKVEPGQSVLIHSATGGVGIAAVQVCRWLGADIFCTVGSQDKIEYLNKTFGIPRNKIFHSRDLTFRQDVLEATNGRGVDVVLNSLSGELLHGSWDCVAEYGTMIEIGKRDLIGKGSLALHLFEQNRSYIGVDFGRICAQRPRLVTGLLKQLMELYKEGKIRPITPMTTFDAARIEDSMRFMQKGAHIGKVVINMPESPAILKSLAPKQKPIFSSAGSYLLAGGLGGLGQAVAVWMAESGATEIIFLSRSANNKNRYMAFIEELHSLGCNAILVPGNVASLDDVERAVKSSTKPIRGVMQATMLLKDAGFLDMTFDEWQAPLLTKVQGTWNLHSALLKHTLDFFLLFSSWSGIVGNTGQSNYAAANSFLDSFVQYRNAHGLTAAVIDLSAVEDIGYASRTSHIMDHFRATSTYTSQEEDILDSLQVMINRSKRSLIQSSSPAIPEDKSQFVSEGQICIGLRSTQPLSSSKNRIIWKRDPRMGLYKNMDVKDGSASAGGNGTLKQFLTDASQNVYLLDGEEAPRLLATEFGIAVFSFLMRDIDLLDLDESLSTLGVDSLVSIELRNWFRQRVGLEFTTLEILGSQSLLALGQLAVGRLKAKFSSSE